MKLGNFSLVAIAILGSCIGCSLSNESSSKSSDTSLSSLSVSPGVLSPSYSNDITSYTVTGLVSTDTLLNIQAVPRDSRTNLAGTGNRTLSTGMNELELTVTAENGATRNVKLSAKRPSPTTFLASSSTIIENWTDSTALSQIVRGKSSGRTVALFSSDPASTLVLHQGTSVVKTVSSISNGLTLGVVLTDQDSWIELTGVGFNVENGHFNTSANLYLIDSAQDPVVQGKALLANLQQAEGKPWSCFIQSDGTLQNIVGNP